MVPRAGAVAVEAATVAYGGLLVGTILVGAGVVFSSHGDMAKAGNAMYKTLQKVMRRLQVRLQLYRFGRSSMVRRLVLLRSVLAKICIKVLSILSMRLIHLVNFLIQSMLHQLTVVMRMRFVIVLMLYT